MASMDAQGGGDEEASVAAWLRRENTNLLKKNRQLKQELKQAETAATGGVDVEALRQKLTTQTREIERLESEVAEGAGAVAELAAARVRVVELQTRLDEAEAENEAREAERETVLAAAQQAGQASSDGQAEAVAAAAEFKAKAKAAVKQQKAKLKEQAQAIESMTGSLATAKAEAASSAKTLKALRAEYKLVDQQREEQGRRAAEAEQKRASAVGQEAAALAKLQQGTEGWQQQRLKAQAKYTQLKEGYKEKLQAAKAYTQQQHEELEALRAAAAAAGGGGAGAHEPGPDELRTSGSPSAPQALIDGFTVPPDAPPAAAAAAASQLPVAVAVAADAEDDEDDEEDGELFGEDLEQEYKLAQGGVQEYIFQLEQERREEREEMDFQIGEYIQRIANLEDEAQRAGRAAAAGVGGGARPVVHAVGQVISTGGAGAGRQGIGGQGMPVGTVAGASGQGAAAAAAAAASQLVEVMGCSEAAAAQAVALAGGDQERALDLLLGGPEAMAAAAAAAAARPPGLGPGARPPPSNPSVGPPGYDAAMFMGPPVVSAEYNTPGNHPPAPPAGGPPVAVRLAGRKKAPAGHYMYELACTEHAGEQWTVERRYSEFEKLRDDLIAAETKVVAGGSGSAGYFGAAPASSIASIQFPGKWGASLWQSEDETARQRYEALRSWVEKVISASITSTPAGQRHLQGFLNHSLE